jgi:tRNA dimethylallyltransferase
MQKLKNRPRMLIIYGPTGVGKTDLALAIAQKVPAEIVNMDVGQFYTPLSIGTAKPDWKNNPIPHHLFDIIDTPSNYTVSDYRLVTYEKIKEIIARGKLPILVGGSGFYLHSLLFINPAATQDLASVHLPVLQQSGQNNKMQDIWQELYEIDPVRAEAIDKSDTYRIQRALDIWHTTGKLPSSCAPIYNPEMDYSIIFVERDRQELRDRIYARVLEMLKAGWIKETEKLIGTPWEQFIRKKNLIGYTEILNYLSGEKNSDAFSRMVELISTKTCQYAKRQFTFWRKLEREIKKEKRYTGTSIGCLETVNLTNKKIHLYISKLINR